MPISLRLGKDNRGGGLDLSVDGIRRGQVSVESEVRVWGEDIVAGDEGWRGGVPTLVGEGAGWVGRLNGLLKFNHSFGEEGLSEYREFETDRNILPFTNTAQAT